MINLPDADMAFAINPDGNGGSYGNDPARFDGVAVTHDTQRPTTVDSDYAIKCRRRRRYVALSDQRWAAGQSGKPASGPLFR
jgi:hypothetical protein